MLISSPAAMTRTDAGVADRSAQAGPPMWRVASSGDARRGPAGDRADMGVTSPSAADVPGPFRVKAAEATDQFLITPLHPPAYTFVSSVWRASRSNAPHAGDVHEPARRRVGVPVRVLRQESLHLWVTGPVVRFLANHCPELAPSVGRQVEEAGAEPQLHQPPSRAEAEQATLPLVGAASRPGVPARSRGRAGATAFGSPAPPVRRAPARRRGSPPAPSGYSPRVPPAATRRSAPTRRTPRPTAGTGRGPAARRLAQAVRTGCALQPALHRAGTQQPAEPARQPAAVRSRHGAARYTSMSGMPVLW